MRSRVIRSICLFITLLFISGFGQSSQSIQATSNMELLPQDRILILAPHPDDEVLGCSGVIQEAKKMNLPIKILFLTYGDNNQWSFLVYRMHPVIMPKAVEAMGLIRHDEALEAAKVFGVSPDELTFLGYPDFRTFNIWCGHWGDNPPARSMLTEVTSVPYKNAFRPGAPYKGEEIIEDLKAVLRGFKPTKIFLSHPADHNGDHRSLYLFTRVALWDIEDEVKAELYPYLVHYVNWPLPRGYHPDEPIIPPDIFKKEISWQTSSLNNEEVDQKHTAIKKHRTQYDSSPGYLLSFIRSNELFGDFPIVKLAPSTPTAVLTNPRQARLKEIPQELVSEERTSFVGIEEHYVTLEDDSLTISITLSRPIKETVGVSVYAFGYRKDRNFKEMPKIHIKFGKVEHRVFDQNKNIPLDLIKIKRTKRKITTTMPLSLLGNPQKILTSAETYLREVPLDWVSWRILEISD